MPILCSVIPSCSLGIAQSVFLFLPKANGRLVRVGTAEKGIYALHMYKVKHKLTPTYIQNMFEENGTKYQLRNGNDFKIPRFRTVRYGRYMGPYLWSTLSRDEKNSDTQHSFISTISRRDLASLFGDNCENCPLCLS